MTRWADGYFRLLEHLIVVALAAMVIMVFGNVVLRYAFNSGITVSEELSRWAFVWLIFIGAVLALREHAHLGSDMLVGHLPPAGQKACLVVSQLVMLYINWLLFQGSLAQMRINWDVEAPVTGAPMAILYASGVFFSVAATVLLLHHLLLTVTGRLSDRDLVMVRESEESAEFEALQARLAQEDRAKAGDKTPGRPS